MTASCRLTTLTPPPWATTMWTTRPSLRGRKARAVRIHSTSAGEFALLAAAATVWGGVQDALALVGGGRGADGGGGAGASRTRLPSCRR